jgi:hypothetical protein
MVSNACANQQVASAGCRDEAVAIANGDAAPAALNQIFTLQSASRMADGGPVHAEHFRQQVLRDGYAVIVVPVAHHEKPSREPPLKAVRAIAACRDHHLLEKSVHVSEHKIAKRRHGIEGAVERASGHSCRGSGYLNQESCG